MLDPAPIGCLPCGSTQRPRSLERGFHYRAHGLDFTSELELPELTPRPVGRSDVVIYRGDVPDSLENAVTCGTRHQIAADECLLNSYGTARYWVRRGSEVVVSSSEGASPDEVRSFILSSVMGALCHQSGLLPLHASAVDVGGECVLFAGNSGAGKSTFAAACHVRGYSVYSDDLTAISVAQNGPCRAHPGYRTVKLWADAIAGFGKPLGPARSLTGRVGKFGVTLPGHGATGPLPVRAILGIDPGTADDRGVQPLAGAEKIRLLLKNTYRVRLMRGMGRRGEHFALAARVADDIAVFNLPRPRGLDGVFRVLDRLEASGWTFPVAP